MSAKVVAGVFFLLAVSAAAAWSQVRTAPILATPIAGTPGPLGANGLPPFSPAQVQQAYGLNNLAASGSGQTIAIVDAYHYPNALSTLNSFCSQFGLQPFNVPGGPTFTQLDELGGTALPGTDPAGAGKSGWALEEALDIEWAHVMAPKANIILYEATNPDSDGLGHLENAVATAKANPAVSVVSMSWGASEYDSETTDDPTYATPTNRLAAKPRQGVTFVASAGDSGAPGCYPAFSPNVIAVGGTSLTLNSNNSYQTESAWSRSGGGVSTLEPKPAYQVSSGTLLGTISNRATPDVSFLGDPLTGVYVYDSFDGSWYQVGGTSLSAPCWAGLIADANELRLAEGYGTLDGLTDTLPALYSLPSTDFNDITIGSNGFDAGPGYDLATGLGTPKADLLVPDLAAYAVPEPSTGVLLAVAGLVALGRNLRRRTRR